MTLAWLTSMTGDRYNLDLLTVAAVERQPTTGTWLLRVVTQDDHLPVVTMVADPRQSVVLAGLQVLVARGWVPVIPGERFTPGAAVNPRALAVVDYQRKRHDWMDRWDAQTAEQRAGHQLDLPEWAEEWEVVLNTISGSGHRLSWPYPSAPAKTGDESSAVPLATETEARAAVRQVTDYISERLAHGPPWSDPDFSDPLWITGAPE